MRRIARRLADVAIDAIGPPSVPPIGTAPLHRVLVVRFGAIGDVVATTALIATIRRVYPAAAITVATSAPADAVLRGHPAIDEILVIPEITAGPRLSRLPDAWRRMRSLSRVPWDAAFLTHGDIYRMLPTLALRARWKVGFDYGGRGRGTGLTHAAAVFDRKDAQHRRPPRPTLAETMVDLLRALVGRDLPAEPARIHLAEGERRAAAERLAALGVPRRFVAVAPGVTVAVKQWPAEAFAELHRRLGDMGIACLLVGGPDDRRTSQAAQAAAPGLRSVVGDLALRESIGLLAAAGAIVGGDTGLIHAGAALGRPTVALFGPTDPYVYGQIGADHSVLVADLECRPCDRTVCAIAPADPVAPCLAAIPARQVADAIAVALDRAGTT